MLAAARLGRAAVRDRRFTRRYAQRWRALRRAGLRRDVLATVARAERELTRRGRRQLPRWPILDREIWPNPVARGSHRAEMRFLRGWLKRRIAWIDRQFGARAALKGAGNKPLSGFRSVR